MIKRYRLIQLDGLQSIDVPPDMTVALFTRSSTDMVSIYEEEYPATRASRGPAERERTKVRFENLRVRGRAGP